MYAISVSTDEIPTKADGERYPYVFSVPSGEAVFADSLTEIVEQVLPQYVECATEEERLTALVDSLTSLAAQTQAAIVAASPDRGDLEEEELTAVFTPKDESVDLDVWSRDLPLLLLVTSYVPFTKTPQPSGDSIVWLDPINERKYLASLEALGVGELMIAESV